MLKVGVLSLVRRSLADAPVSSELEVTLLAVGAVKSMTAVAVVPAAVPTVLMLSALSVTLALNVCEPSASAEVLMVTKPAAMSSAVIVVAADSAVVPSYTTTVSPATTALPSMALVFSVTLTAGVASLPNAATVRVGVAGATLSSASAWLTAMSFSVSA